MNANLEDLVRKAAAGDVSAFVTITRRFQNFAFGSALTLLGDFETSEEVVQEAFLAAWSSLDRLEEPAAFAGWLRAIVRRQPFRVLRKKRLSSVPLAEAEDAPSEEPLPDARLEEREAQGAVLASTAALPAPLREPATLFYVHDCSQQDIASFLGLSVATVNNRLHAARAHLKERMLTMVEDTLHSHALPDAFAHRIGRLIEARGVVVEALFDPTSLPDILTELAVSDEANRRTVAVQVVQRPGGGLVRGIALSPLADVPRGATVLSSGHHVSDVVTQDLFARIVPALVGPSPVASGAAELLETGIKAIDVLCPLVAGGSVALAGEAGTGLTVLMEELVYRLSGGADRISLVVPMPPPAAPWAKPSEEFSYGEALKKSGYSEGTQGAVQTFFLRGQEEAWTASGLPALQSVDAVIHLSRIQAAANAWPAIEPLTSRSLAPISKEHAAIAGRVRDALAALRSAGEAACAALPMIRAQKLQAFFGQPFFIAASYTKRPGSHVSLADALQACREILDGKHDDLPIEAFAFGGSIAELRAARQK